MANFKSAVLSLVGPRLLAKARVTSNLALGESFRHITIESDAFANMTWNPGAKIQLNTGQWEMRTYTPISIDPAKLQLEFVAYLAGMGPGAEWAKSARAGDIINIKGPDGSLRLSPQAGRIVVFGDETAFGLAHGIHRSLSISAEGPAKVSHPIDVHFVFEVTSPDRSKPALEHLGLNGAQLFPKDHGDGFEGNIDRKLQALLLEFAKKDGLAQVILAGRAKSIQALRKAALASGVSSRKLITKVYWAEGRSGLE